MKKILFSIIFTLAALVGLTAAFATAVSADAGPDWNWGFGAVGQYSQRLTGLLPLYPPPNAVVMYHRNFDGSLSLVGSYPTGGVGLNETAPDPLGSQNSVLLTPDGKWLLVVNAGDNETDGER